MSAAAETSRSMVGTAVGCSCRNQRFIHGVGGERYGRRSDRRLMTGRLSHELALPTHLGPRTFKIGRLDPDVDAPHLTYQTSRLRQASDANCGRPSCPTHFRSFPAAANDLPGQRCVFQHGNIGSARRSPATVSPRYCTPAISRFSPMRSAKCFNVSRVRPNLKQRQRQRRKPRLQRMTGRTGGMAGRQDYRIDVGRWDF